MFRGLLKGGDIFGMPYVRSKQEAIGLGFVRRFTIGGGKNALTLIFASSLCVMPFALEFLYKAYKIKPPIMIKITVILFIIVL